VYLIVAAVLLLVMAGCGGDDNGNGDANGSAQGGGEADSRVEIAAQNNKFDESRLVVPANTEVTVVFENRDAGVLHSFAVYRTQQATDVIHRGDLVTGTATREEIFRSPEPGSYFFRCDVHPDTMTGSFVAR
jgi:plastocyanin